MIVAEKLHSFLARPQGNSRSKDLFDLMFYLPLCNRTILVAAIEGTFAARGDSVPLAISKEFQSIHTDTLRRGWNSAVSNVGNVGSFDAVFDRVVVLLKVLS